MKTQTVTDLLTGMAPALWLWIALVFLLALAFWAFRVLRRNVTTSAGAAITGATFGLVVALLGLAAAFVLVWVFA